MKTAKRREKPAKPYRDFPLFLHATRQWAKKVRCKMHYIGKDADAALQKWLDERDDLQAGRTLRLHPVNGPTVRELVNRYLSSKKSLLDVGELSLLTWRHYYLTCEALVEPVRVRNGIQEAIEEDHPAESQQGRLADD